MSLINSHPKELSECAKPLKFSTPFAELVSLMSRKLFRFTLILAGDVPEMISVTDAVAVAADVVAIFFN